MTGERDGGGKGPLPKHDRTAKDIVTNLVSGAVAGAVAKSTIAPLDRAKITFQVSSKIRFTYLNCYTFLVDSARNEGFRHLWKGNSATMIRIMPYAAISFMSNEHYKNWFRAHSRDRQLSHSKRFLSGSLAGLTASTATYGLEVIRSRMAIHHDYNKIIPSLRKIIKNEGARSLYRGISPTLLGVSIYGGISFYTFGALKEWDPLGKDSLGELSIRRRLLYGAFAGLLGQSISYPLDVTRRRMQTGGSKGDKLERYSSMRKTMKHIAMNEGIRKGLYKGLSLNFIKGPISSSISYTVFDYVNHFFAGKESY